jgi:hypothetical protein
MSIVCGGKARADVEELANPDILGQVTDRAGKKGPGSASDNGDTRENILVLVTGLAVDSIIVLAAQPVVPDPGRVRHRGVNGGPGDAIRAFRPRLALRL